MKGYVTKPQTINRLFVANANPLLAERLDAFELHPIKNRDHVLQAVSAKAISVSGDIDRNEFETGNGLALRRYEFGLQQIPTARGVKLDDSTSMTVYREGMAFEFGLDLGNTESELINKPPLFDGTESIKLQYFIPRVRHIGERVLLNFVENVEDFSERYTALTESVDAHTSKVTRPRVVKPQNVGWPQTLTPIMMQPDSEPA